MGFNPRGHIEGQNAEELRYILLHKVASDPTAIAAVEAQFYYNTTSQVVKYRNSSAWVFLPYVTASLTTSALLQGTGYAISSFTNGTGSTGFVKVNTSSVPSLQQYVAFADINSSAICTSIVAPGDNITLTTEKAVVDYVTSQISAISTVSPAGNDTEIQYNNAGNFGANASLTYNNTTKTLLLSNTIDGSGVTFPTFKIHNGGLEGYMWCEDDGVFYIASNGGMDLFASSITLSGTYLGINSGNVYVDNGTASKFMYLNGSKYITYVDAIVPADISGTANYLSKFTGTHTLGNSVIYESSGKIGVNNTTPAYALDVKSQIAVTTTTELPTLSEELNTNPTGWTCGTNWTNNLDGTYTCTAGSGALSTTIPTVTGRRYLITWNFAGSININYLSITLGAVTIQKNFVDSNPSFDITAGVTGTTTLTFQWSSGSAGIVSNISIKELTLITSRVPPVFSHNTSIGVNAELRSNLSLYSLGIGLDSLGYIHYGGTNVGKYNHAFGYKALSNNTVGYNNVAFGYNTLISNTSGYNNIAVGSLSLYNNIAGQDNIAIGKSSLYACTNGYCNIAIGSNSLSHLTSGYYNTAIGESALVNCTAARYNIGIGVRSLFSTTTGSFNVALGAYSLTDVVAGSQNTVIGYSAGSNITSGSTNILLGYSAGEGITSGSSNTIIGSYNTVNQIVGTSLYQSLGLSSDTNLIFLGYGTTKQKLGSIMTNSVCIGNYARVYENNQVILGNNEITSTYLKGNVEIRNWQILATNNLSEPTFATHTKWTETGDIAYNTNKFTYTHNTGSGTLEQTTANFATAIKPNTWYKISYTISIISGTGIIAGTIDASLNGNSITGYFNNGTSYIYLKSGPSPTPFGNFKLNITTTGARVFDITFAGIEEVIGGDLYVNNDIEQRRGTYQYFRQYFGTDTDGDWRTYCDGSGLYVEYRTGGAWVNKHTISTYDTP